MSYQHLTISSDKTNASIASIGHIAHIAHIELDYHGKSANLLSQAMIAELQSAFDELEAQEGLAGVIIYSAKPSGFVFGADITEFETLSNSHDVRALQKAAMVMLDRIADSHLVSVALVHGPALGGGLELALACDYRLCRKGGRIMAGFPEANLGLMPGFAGTARAARLIGARQTLDMCLSAKPLTTQSALIEAGLADGLFASEDGLAEAMNFIAKGKRAFGEFCDRDAWEAIIATAKQAHLDGRIEAHIPHLAAIITHFEMAGPDYQALVDGELIHFPRLMLDEVSANLRRVFALTDRVKKQARGDSAISHVQVVGAGAMGADIAIYLCLKGLHVYLTDVNEAALAKAYQRAQAYFERKCDAARARQALARFTCGLMPDNAVLIDLVIEAAPEKLPLKQALWQELEALHGPDCLFATNSSALDLDEIAGKMTAPNRLMGLHFFNPATVMPLIEVIHRPVNEPADCERLMQFAGQIGKLPIKVQNSPGFLVNRALLPYIFAAIEAHINGTDADEIDEALLLYGMPMGPLELADQIGLDICFDVGARLGMPGEVKDYLNAKITAQDLGRKTGAGIYRWDGKKADRMRGTYEAQKAQALAAHLLAPLRRACYDCVAEGHVAHADFADAGMIFGTGYPRHTGGPLHSHKG